MKKKIIGFLIAILLMFIVGFSISLNTKAFEKDSDGHIIFNKSISDEWKAFCQSGTYGGHSISDAIKLNYCDFIFDKKVNVVKKIDDWCRTSSDFTTVTNGEYSQSQTYSGVWGNNSICLEPDSSDNVGKYWGKSEHRAVALVSIDSDGSTIIQDYNGNEYSAGSTAGTKDMAFLSTVATKLREGSANSGGNNLPVNSTYYYDLYVATLFIWNNCGFYDQMETASGITFPHGGGNGQFNNAYNNGAEAFDRLKEDPNFKNLYGNCKAKIVVWLLSRTI